MPSAPAQPVSPSDPASEVAALRAECQRLRDLSARQAQEFAALQALMVPRCRKLDQHAINTLQRLADGTPGFLLYVQR
jgi:hypothetical protein